MKKFILVLITLVLPVAGFAKGARNLSTVSLDAANEHARRYVEYGFASLGKLGRQAAAKKDGVDCSVLRESSKAGVVGSVAQPKSADSTAGSF